jgi:WhiB family redox-sensing transcriptional regulator
MSRADQRQWSDGAAGPVLRAVRDGSWRDRGACRSEDPALFFPGQGGARPTQVAMNICRGCPVRTACLAYAVDRGDSWGVWGGVLFERGRPQSDPAAGIPEDVCGQCGNPWTEASTIWNDRAHTRRECRICRIARDRQRRQKEAA